MGSIGYTDISNANFRITGYRFEGQHVGNGLAFNLHIDKVKDDVSCKYSIVKLEDIQIISSSAGSGSGSIVDNTRSGARNFSTVLYDFWSSFSDMVLKQGDFDTFFGSDENVFYSATSDEGVLIYLTGDIGAPNGITYGRLQVRYQIF